MFAFSCLGSRGQEKLLLEKTNFQHFQILLLKKKSFKLKKRGDYTVEDL